MPCFPSLRPDRGFRQALDLHIQDCRLQADNSLVYDPALQWSYDGEGGGLGGQPRAEALPRTIIAVLKPLL